MNKQLLFLLLCISFSFSTIIKSEEQEDLLCGSEPISIGNCGKQCNFTYYHIERKLEIEGEEMDDFDQIFSIPWYLQLQNIKTIELKNIKNIGKNAFISTTSLNSIIIHEYIQK